tara:strand:- start:339 stop:554 length:216 start_codon:yes stop_codon:yes gene_type:complete
MKMHRQNYNRLKTTREKRLYALKFVTDEKYIKLLEYEKISLSTIDIAFKLFLGDKIIIKPININNFKHKKY